MNTKSVRAGEYTAPAIRNCRCHNNRTNIALHLHPRGYCGIPDDHDVYHGSLWGAGGVATPEGLTGAVGCRRIMSSLCKYGPGNPDR